MYHTRGHVGNLTALTQIGSDPFKLLSLLKTTQSTLRLITSKTHRHTLIGKTHPLKPNLHKHDKMDA